MHYRYFLWDMCTKRQRIRGEEGGEKKSETIDRWGLDV